MDEQNLEQLFFPEAMITAPLIAEAGGCSLLIVSLDNARVQVGGSVCYLSTERALRELGRAIQQLVVDWPVGVTDDQ
ncbi:hypothetical protein BH10CHL1_BH10CHL1_47920 [soil metagenome]